MNQPDDPGQVIREVHHYHGGAERTHSFGRLVDTVMPAAIIGLVGVIWMLSNSVTRLTEQVSYLANVQNTQFADVKSRLTKLEGKVDQ